MIEDGRWYRHTLTRACVVVVLSFTMIDILNAAEPGGSEDDVQCTGPRFEISGYWLDSVRLDYKGDAIVLRFSDTDSLTIHANFKPNAAFSGDEVFQFIGGTVCRRELVMRGFDIDGTEKSEILTGTNATDRITGNAGNDTLNGGVGDDTYIYELGGGLDCISDPGGSNRVVFGQGISAQSLVARTIDQDRFAVVQVRLHDRSGRIRGAEGVDIRFNRGGVAPIVAFQFADGKTLDLRELLERKPAQPPTEGDFMRNCIFDIEQAERAGMINERHQHIPPPRMRSVMPGTSGGARIVPHRRD